MLYLECNSIIILHRASALIVHVGGGREGKIGNQLHRLFYNVHGISSLSFWRDSSSRIARVFSVAQWPNGRQVSCRGLQVIQRIKKREMFTHQGHPFKMWILAILQHPQMHHQFKRQRQRRLTDLEKRPAPEGTTGTSFESAAWQAFRTWWWWCPRCRWEV